MKFISISFVLAIIIIGSKYVPAQTSINSAGGEAVGSGGSSSFSAGQVFYRTKIGLYENIVEGVQQTYEVTVIIDNIKELGYDISCKIFPNPTSNILNVEIHAKEANNYTVTLCNLQGKILIEKNLLGNKDQLDVNHLIPSAYFLNVFLKENGSKLIKTFKIIKH